MLISRSRVQPLTTIKFLAATTALSAPHAMLSQRAAPCRLQRCSFRHFISQPLKSAGTILAANLPAVLVSLGAVVGAGNVALAADSASDPTMIPLKHVPYVDGEITWLGIMAGINDGSPRLYMFDTGSDQFNAQIAPDTTGVKPVPGARPQLYGYDDGATANWVQRVQFESLSYYDPDDISTPVATYRGGFQAAKVLDILVREDHRKGHHVSDEPVFTDADGTKFYADLDIHQRIQNDQPGEQPPFYGIFGAGDFLSKQSAPSSAIGGRTKSGYIVSGNANLDIRATPGCAPCLIMDLNSSLRAQFTSFVPWGEKSDENSQDTFPGSNANASTEEGKYNLEFTTGDENNPVPVQEVEVFLDTGFTRASQLDISRAKFDKLNEAGVVKKDQDGKYYIPKLKISSPNGEPIELRNAGVSVQRDESADYIHFTAGIEFFQQNSVIYDLENKATGYTPRFVSANDFTTSASNADELRLNRITAQMGSQGWFGIAGVISGSGDLTLDPKTDVRLTGANTYTGATYINHDAYLSLAGLGGIEGSAKVVADGKLDISEHGANDYWGIPESENDVHIRSLSGNGSVLLGDQTLVLTAANDAFAGRINDLDDQKNHLGGGLVVAGGVQTLSGKNDYTGMTTVRQDAGLLLAKTGSITHDVITSGLLGNDGQVGGIALAKDGGVVAGSGSFGAVTIADGAAIAPGNALDPAMPIATLTVDGDFKQQAGSIYQAGLASSPDRINVGGSAAIDGGAQIELLNQGMALVDKRYTLLTAAGGVNGTYGGLTGTLHTDSPFVDFELAYDPTNVYLHTYRTATAFADVGNTFNQRSAGAASQALGAGNQIHDGILFLTAQESRNAFDLLSGEIHASVHSALIQDSHFVRDAASDRIRAAFDGVGASPVPVMSYGPGGPEIAPADGDRLAVWGRGFGAWGHLDGDGNAARLDRSTGGFLAGADTLVGQHWRLGLLAGYSHTSFEVDDRASSGSSNNYHLGLYAGTQHGNLGFRSGLAYSWHRIETDRTVAFPGFSDRLSADYDAGTFQAFGELGYRMDTASASFEPYANLSYVRFDTDGFSEGGGTAALSGGDRSSDTTFTTLGLRASSVFTMGSMTATARGGIGWRHAFGDVTPETRLAFAGGSSFAVKGAPIAKNAAVLEAGLDINFSETATLGLTYQGQLASDAQEHGVNARLAVRF